MQQISCGPPGKCRGVSSGPPSAPPTSGQKTPHHPPASERRSRSHQRLCDLEYGLYNLYANGWRTGSSGSSIREKCRVAGRRVSEWFCTVSTTYSEESAALLINGVTVKQFRWSRLKALLNRLRVLTTREVFPYLY